jgi:hypothetical protein
VKPSDRYPGGRADIMGGMKLSPLVLLLVLAACKQGSPDSAVLADDERELPGPEVFEGGPTAQCVASGVKLTVTMGPAGDYKWARLTDAPVPDGNPRVEYLQADSSRIRKQRGGELVSGRWSFGEIEAKVFFDVEPADCQVIGYVLTREQAERH